MAGVAAQTILSIQANAPPGTLAAELELGADFHYVVHQATGMVAAQLEVGVGQALIRLRAYAYAHDQTLTDVARAVISHELVLDADPHHLSGPNPTPSDSPDDDARGM